MTNEVLTAVGVAGVAIALFAFAYFHVYGGLYGSLKNAKVGEVYNFEYEQPLHGDPERFLAKNIGKKIFLKLPLDKRRYTGILNEDLGIKKKGFNYDE